MVCGARLSQRWSGACLSYTLEGGGLHPSESLDKYLGSPEGVWGVCPGASVGGPALQTLLLWSRVQVF